VAVSRQAVLAGVAAQKLEEEDVDAEVIDLRSIRPIDWKMITESVRRTSRCLVVEEGWPTYGVGAEIAAGVQERCFDYLDGPVLRLGGAEVPMPYNRELERASIPSAEDISSAALRVVGKKAAATV
jgi:pyruvate dehydrogenase E1 component beta subunit